MFGQKISRKKLRWTNAGAKKKFDLDKPQAALEKQKADL